MVEDATNAVIRRTMNDGVKIGIQMVKANIQSGINKGIIKDLNGVFMMIDVIEDQISNHGFLEESSTKDSNK